MKISDEDLRGRSVITADGQVIGEVATLFMESSNWQIESLRVKLRNDAADQIGASRGLLRAGTINVPVSSIQSVGDAVILSVAAADLRASGSATSSQSGSA